MAEHWTDEFFVTAAEYKEDDGIVLCGDAGECMMKFPLDRFKLCFTDPDWTKGNTHGYQMLATYLPRLLKDRGRLIVEVPQNLGPLFNIMSIFHWIAQPQGLLPRWMYHWDYCEGGHSRLRMGIEVMWKPLLCYVKGKWPVRTGYVRDGFKTVMIPKRQKKHDWQKSLDGYLYYIEKHSEPGDIVFDPFVGSGTTAFACRKLGRRFVVIDMDQQLCKAIAQELNNGS